MLAGLAEEHEGIAATLRTLHPTGEPRPTLGLAALVLGDGPDDSAAGSAAWSPRVRRSPPGC